MYNSNLNYKTMNWYIGQEIVCVKTHSLGLVKRGRTYTVKGLMQSPCTCKKIDIDVGIPYNYSNYSGNMECGCCHEIYKSNGITWFNESLFAPLDQDISELTEILEQPIKQVVKL